jgi:hypothetical protein
MTQSVSANYQAELDKGQTEPRVFIDLVELYDYDATPPFDPNDAIERFAAEEYTWDGFAYRRELESISDIRRTSRDRLNTATLNFSNISRYLATLAQSQQMEGLIVVIRTVADGVIDDSTVQYYGKLGKPGTVDKRRFSISAEQYFGDHNVIVPPNRFEADDPEGRLPSDPLFEGIPFTAVTGSNAFTVPTTKSSFFGLFRKTVNETRYRQWSSSDDTPYGQVIREIFGRCQVELVHFRWADKGTHVGMLSAIGRGPLESVTQVKSRTEGLSDPVCNFSNPPAPGVVHLGNLGTANLAATCQADLAQGLYFSGLSYLEGASIGIENGVIKPLGVDQDDSPPVWTAIVKGKKVPLPNASGVYGAAAWTNNPVAILRFILTDSKWLNIDPAFIDDEVNFETYKHCDEPIIDLSNTQVISVPSGDFSVAGEAFQRYLQSGRYTSRHFLYYNLGDTSIVPELVDGPYVEREPGDPFPDPSDPTDPTYFEQKPLVKRYTFNCPINDEVKATDFINKTLLPSFKGYLRIGKNGKIQILSERPADATRLRTATAFNATSIPVLDVTPWKSGPDLLKGRILLGVGLTTSEVRTPSAAVYSTSGNSVTLTSSGSGITATASGASLSGGSTTVQASGTVTISGTPNAGDTVTVTIDGIAVVYILNADDTTGTVAAMLAHYINGNQRLKRYIRASWSSASPTIVTITCLHGALTVPALLKAHTTALADPITTPTSAAAAGGSLPAGTYLVGYANVNAIGSTVLTSLASVTVVANGKINISSLPALVGTGRNFYISEKAGSVNLRLVASRTDASNFSISTVPDPGSPLAPTWNTTAEELIRVAMSFATNSQDIFPSWKPSTAFALNEIVLPSPLNGHKYEVTTAGTTAASAPTWPTTSGGTVADGTVVFTEIGSTVLEQAGLTRANILKDTLRWPLGTSQSSYNQIKGEFISAKNDFARTPIRVTDRFHKAKVKQTLPLEIDLSGVDGENQADRLADFNLSKYREGDWLAGWGTSEPALVLEEGDVVCFSDDSGGLVNQVVRIEDLRIRPKSKEHPHEVFIDQARKYSTHMFSDDVGAHVIPIPSTLRFSVTKDSIVSFIDTIATRDSHALVPGLIIAVSHDLEVEGDWRGWTLHADFGDGYKQIGEGDVAASIGECDDVLDTVSDATVFDETSEVTFTLRYTDFNFSDSTEAELEANPYRNLFLIGNEYVQAATIVDNGSRNFTISNLWRGRFETDGPELIHSADERVVVINGAEKFVEIPVDKVNQEFNYKVVTTNQGVADATAIPFTWIGNNVRPRKTTSHLVAVDASKYRLIQFDMHARSIEEPATAMVEIWATSDRNNPADLLRKLPVTPGTSHACLLNSSGSPAQSSGGGVTTIEDSHTDKNNLVGAVATTVGGQTLEDLTSTFTRYDFTLNAPTVIGGGLVIAGLGAGLHADPVFSTTGRNFNEATAPIGVVWDDGADETYVTERVVAGGVTVATNDIPTIVVGGVGSIAQRYTILLSGTEYRVYRDYVPSAGNVPIAIVSSPSGGFPFPLRLHMIIPSTAGTNDASILNVMAAGNLRPTTIYSADQQIEDFGVEQEFLNLRIYQVSRYPGIGNPVDGSVDGQGFHTDLVTPSGHPESEAGLIEWWDASDQTPGSLTSWTGRANGLVMSGGTAPTAVASVLNGKNIVRFGGTQYLNFTAITTIRTVYIVWKHDQSTTTHRGRFMPILGHSTLADWIGQEGTRLVNSGASANVTGGSAYVNGYPVPLAPLGKSGEFEVVTFVTTGNTTAANFGNDRNAHFFAGDVAHILLYDQAHDAATVARISHYLEGLGALELPALVVPEGDSLSADRPNSGSGLVAAGDAWPCQMIPVLSPTLGNYDTYNVAVGGQTLAQMIADFATEVAPLYNAARPANIYTVWGGTNDMGTGGGATSGATTYARLVTLCQMAQAVGFQVVTAPVLKRNDLSNFPNQAALDAFEVQRGIFNASLRANWATFSDAFVDLETLDFYNNTTGVATPDTVMDLLDPDNTVFFNADKIHTIARGQTVSMIGFKDEIIAL